MLRDIRMLKRVWHAARTFGAHNVLPPPEWKAYAPQPLKWAKAFGLFRAKKNLAHGRSGKRLARAFTELGPSYIKLGQFLATRPDVVGAELARDLAELQDRLPPFTIAEAEQILSEELSPELRATIGDIGDAIAAASIAQVHKVMLTQQAEGAPPRVRATHRGSPSVHARAA